MLGMTCIKLREESMYVRIFRFPQGFTNPQYLVPLKTGSI